MQGFGLGAHPSILNYQHCGSLLISSGITALSGQTKKNGRTKNKDKQFLVANVLSQTFMRGASMQGAATEFTMKSTCGCGGGVYEAVLASIRGFLQILAMASWLYPCLCLAILREAN
jgi:hypothetical protein